MDRPLDVFSRVELGVAACGFFALVIPVRFLGTDDALSIAGLSVWSLLYIWLGIRLGVRRQFTSG